MTAIILSGIVVFITHALEAITGFGCTVLALPFVTALLGLEKGVIVLTTLGWLLALYIVITKWKDINFKEFFKIFLTVLLGLPIGMYLFRTIDSSGLKKILALFIIFASSRQLIITLFPKKSEKSSTQFSEVLQIICLFVGGIVHGMFSSGGPLVVLYAAKKLPKKNEFRATLCLLWTCLNTIIIAGYFFMPQSFASCIKILLYMMPFLVAGIIAGEMIYGKVKTKVFSIIVFGMLFITGFIMLFI